MKQKNILPPCPAIMTDQRIPTSKIKETFFNIILFYFITMCADTGNK